MGLQIPGQLAILFALGFTIISGFAFFRLAQGKKSFGSLAHLSYDLFTISTIFASAWLFYLFFIHQFIFKYVYDYSDSTLPFFYLLSAFWGGQEGTYLLWVMLNAFFGYIIIKRGGPYANWGMVVFSLVNFFLLLIMVRLSPFAMLSFIPPEGAGLNPLLQDPWMVVHPPIMFIGYSASAIPFALTMAALIRNDFREHVKRIFPWVGITALMIGAGNILGGYWAYKTLGWGGYWAWDPVENSSLIPWFVSLALLHGLLIERRTGAFKKINVFLSALTFVLVIYGTFLTRSGVLADFSVHSFVDLGVNSYLISFMSTIALLCLALFFYRRKSLQSAPLNYNIYGKEFSLFAGMILSFLFAMVVLFWSSLPLLTTAIGVTPRAADIDTYNSFALPLGILFAFLLTVAPFTTYAPPSLSKWQTKLVVGAVFSILAGFAISYFLLHAIDITFIGIFALVVTGLIMYMQQPELMKKLVPSATVFIATIILCIAIGIQTPMYILFFAVAASCVISNVIVTAQIIPHNWQAAGGRITHFGFGIMLVGILGSSAFVSNERLILTKNESTSSAYGLNLVYQGMEHDISYPKNELILAIEKNGKTLEGRPQLYYSRRLDGIMKRPYIQKSLWYDLYFSPQQVEEPDPGEGLYLKKGHKVNVGDFAFEFDGYKMGNHGSGDMKVTARILVNHNNDIDTILPAIAMLTAEDGSSTLMDYPAELTCSQTYMVSIKQIRADDGSVVLDIPGLLDSNAKPGRLLLDISKKPIINLVWVGTTLLLLGTAIVFLKRRYELLSSSQ